jgi:hypothetical protein
MWLQGADPVAVEHRRLPRGEREEAVAPQGAVADPVDPVNPYPSPFAGNGGGSPSRGKRVKPL